MSAERQQQIEALRVEENERGTPILYFPDDEQPDGEGCREATVAEWRFWKERQALAARLSGLQDTLAEIRRVALDGDDGRIRDALARCDAIDEIAALALNTDGPDGGAS